MTATVIHEIPAWEPRKLGKLYILSNLAWTSRMQSTEIILLNLSRHVARFNASIKTIQKAWLRLCCCQMRRRMNDTNLMINIRKEQITTTQCTNAVNYFKHLFLHRSTRHDTASIFCEMDKLHFSCCCFFYSLLIFCRHIFIDHYRAQEICMQLMLSHLQKLGAISFLDPFFVTYRWANVFYFMLKPELDVECFIDEFTLIRCGTMLEWESNEIMRKRMCSCCGLTQTELLAEQSCQSSESEFRFKPNGQLSRHYNN